VKLRKLKVRCKSIAYRFFTRMLGSTSFKSRLFESAVGLLDKQLTNKGFSLNIRLSGIEPYNSIYFKASKMSCNDWTLVFQGGFENIEQINFFKTSIEYFVSVFHMKSFIVSTFQLSPEFHELLDNYKHREKIYLIESEDPGTLPTPWAKNLLRQIRNSYNGILYARELDYEKVVKLRIDQRFKGRHSFIGIDWLLSNFPSPQSLAKGRIIASSLNTYKSLPLFMSDCIHFGYTEDLIEYWKDADREDFKANSYGFLQNLGLNSNLLHHPEVWLSSRYIQSKGIDGLGIAQANNFFWSKLAAVVDASEIKHEWQKQPRALIGNYKSTKWLEGTLNSSYVEMTHWDWLFHYGNQPDNR